MATDMTLLQGEVTEDQERQEMNIEKMMVGLLRALLEEQNKDEDKESK